MMEWRRVASVLMRCAPEANGRRIGFMHVPRTSGTTLVREIGREVGAGRSAYAFDPVLFGDFTDFDSLARPHRRMVHLDARRLPRRADLLAGHLSRATLQAAGRETLMTVLREPRSRLLSHWMFWRNHTDADLRPLGRWGERVKLARAPLSAFLSDPSVACQTDNIVTRMLLWPDPRIPVDGHIEPDADEGLREAAIAALDRFAFADLIENPGLHANLGTWLGMSLRYERRNETRPLAPGRTTSLDREMDLLTCSLMTQRCRLDTALWSHLANRRLGAAAASSVRAQAEQAGLRRCALLLTGAASAPDLHTHAA